MIFNTGRKSWLNAPLLRRLASGFMPALLVAACAPQAPHSTPAPPRPRSEWATKWSDIAPDPAFRFGRLPNGMRYAIRANGNPKGTALVRMEVEAGSLDESDEERGYAHFVEHMAFNGSRRVAEGEMVKLLQREGLAFGADTNAFTSHTETIYHLDLPRNDAGLLGTALMLMRETASELTFAPTSVEREKGVVLSEMRDRNSWQLRNYVEQSVFGYPHARFVKRLPIGTAELITGATADKLKAFWKREYVPSQTTVVVVGDFDPDKVEAAIRDHFADWQPTASAPQAQPGAGPVNPRDRGRTDVYIDPALSERVAIARNGPWRNEPDSVANRREKLLRDIGYGVINRRLLRISRQQKPPFRAAGLATENVFRAGRTTSLVINTVDGRWRRGMLSATAEYRRALAFGFSAREITEQVANLRSALHNAAASQDTRANRELVDAVINLIREERVPALPADALARFEAFAPQITPETVLAALKRDAIPLDDPNIRFSGRKAPDGGAAALRSTWAEAMREKVEPLADEGKEGFAYTDFGPAGHVVADSREPLLGIRQVRFANGVRLNIKHTDIEKERVLVQLSLDGGDMLNTRAAPLATEMTAVLAAGGLGKHSQDELQTILAGRTVGAGFTSTAESFATLASTTPTDLELQLEVLTAYIVDPGYRPEGQTLYYNSINTFFTRIRATPSDALANTVGGILSDNDPRFTLQPVEAFRALTFAKLRRDLSDRFAHGAIEIGVVGDVDEDKVIADVARTLGALPQREANFRSYAEQRTRPFTADRSRHIVRHTGPADQAIVRLTWPTRDGEDPVDTLRLGLLEKLAQNALTERIREVLGKAYSPWAASELSRVWRGYGTFTLAAPVNVGDVSAVRGAILKAVADLRDRPPGDDEMRRAREPMLEALANRLKTNRGWMEYVDRAQTEPDRIERQQHAQERLSAITPAEIQAIARRYLTDGGAVEIDVLPEGVDVAG